MVEGEGNMGGGGEEYVDFRNCLSSFFMDCTDEGSNVKEEEDEDVGTIFSKMASISWYFFCGACTKSFTLGGVNMIVK
jgi:hypothetical protein